MNDWNLDRFENILFDMDGVLTDSMPNHCLAWQRIFYRLGISVTREEILKREGEQGTATLKTMLSECGPCPPEDQIREILDEKEAIFKSMERPPLFPGARELVQELRDQGKKLALVTGTSRTEVTTNVPQDFLCSFHAIVTGDQVNKGKPDPEPYLLALDELGGTPDNSLVIENAPYGIQSAKRAGLPCIALTTSLSASNLHEADKVIRDLSELRTLLLK